MPPYKINIFWGCMDVSGALLIIGVLMVLDSAKYLVNYSSVKSVSLGSLIFFNALMCFYNIFLFNGDIIHTPLLFGVENILLNLSVLSGFLLAESFFEAEFVWKRWYFLFFLFPLPHFFLHLPFALLTFEEKEFLVQRYFSGDYTISQILLGSSLWTLAGVTLASGYVIFKGISKLNWRKLSEKKKKEVRLGLSIFALSCTTFPIFWFYKLFFPVESLDVLALLYTTNFFFIYLFFKFVQEWPYYYRYGFHFFDLYSFKIEQKRYYRFTDDTLEELHRKLRRLFNDERIYMDEDISLTSLAKLLEINPPLLSEFLRRNYNKNFNEYINEQRIREAKRLMLEEPEKEILEVCYEVGYKNVSTYYKAFKSETGYTPGKWREALREEKS